VAGKDERIAGDLARHLLAVRRLRGVPLWQEERLWLLSRPARRPPDPAALARALLAAELPRRNALAELLGASEVLPVSAGTVGKGAHRLGRLRRARGPAGRVGGQVNSSLHRLVQQGERPLRGYRQLDLSAMLERIAGSLERLTACHAASEAGGPALRALALTSAPEGDHSDEDLLRAASGSTLPEVKAYAAAVLGIRHRANERRSLELCGALEEFELARGARVRQVALVHLALLCDRPRAKLSWLAQTPRRARERLAPLATRLRVLFGSHVAWRALRDLLEPWRDQDTRRARERWLSRFVELASGRASPEDRAEDLVIAGIKRLPRLRAPAARRLARLLAGWIDARGGLSGHLPARRSLIRRAGLGLADGVEAAARAMVEEVAAQAPATPEGPPRSTEAAVLSLHLSHPDVPIRVPPGRKRRHLETVGRALGQLSSERAAELWPALLRCDQKTLERCTLLEGDVPARLVERLLRLGQPRLGQELLRSPRRLEGYLDAAEAIRRVDPEFDAGEEWFRSIFEVPGAWGSALVLALIGRSTSGEAQQRTLSLLHALARVLPRERGLAEALAEWNTVVVHEPPAALHRLAGLLEVAPEELSEYLHLRRLAGHGETFSSALEEPLRRADREEGELSFLQKRLADPKLTEAERVRIARRCERLEDTEERRQRREADARRARRRLSRALLELRRESLKAVLQRVLRRSLERLIGELPDRELPEGLLAALHLFHAPRIDRQQLARFLLDVLHGRPPADRPESRDWLERARRSGVDTAAWQRGLHLRLAHEGQELSLDTEHDPLHVLQMGSYFDTCLRLEAGENAASTLLNALEVNKQVLYLRRSDGVVVGRKLVGATSEGALAGYHTYLSEGGADLRAQVNRAIAEHAGACGLTPSATATPERLTEGFWYDDGNEPWPPSGATVALPAGLPTDPAARWEHTFVHAMNARGVDRQAGLRELGACAARGWTSAAAYWIVLDGAETEPWPSWDVRQLLVGRGVVDLALPGDRFGYDRLCELFEAMPPEREVIDRIAALARRLVRRPDPAEGYPRYDGLVSPPGSTALLDPPELVQLFQDSLRLAAAPARECLTEHEDCVRRWHTDWAEVLAVSVLRTGESRPLERGLGARADPHLRAIVLDVASRLRLPGLAEPLRKALRVATGEELPLLALAVGNLGEERDAWRLETLLRQHPESLEVGAALCRCGASQRARELWQMPDPRELSHGLRELALLDELGLEVPAERFAGLISPRELSDKVRERCKELLCLAAHVGLDPERVTEDPRLDVEYRVARLHREAAAMARGGADIGTLLEARADIVHRLQRQGEQIPPALSDPIREQIWRAAMAGHEAAARHLVQETYGFRKPRRAGLLLALLGGELHRLTGELCHSVGRETHAVHCDQLCDVAVRLRFLAHAGDLSDLVVALMPDEHSVYLWLSLGTDAPEAAVARTILDRRVYQTWHNLDLLLRWLPPEVAEPEVALTLDRMADHPTLLDTISELLLEEQAAVFDGLDDPERSASYRLQRAVIERLVPRLSEADRASLLEKIRASDHPRADWYLELL
jgi:hypothetical protein